VPASYDISGWDLNVKSWRPGPAAGDLVRTETIGGVTTTNRRASTAITEIDVEIDEMTTWDKIPEIGRDVSGTAHYESSFDWDADSADGAYLDLGDSLDGGMTVWINGRKVGGEVSTTPSKVRQDVGGVGKATIDDGTGTQVPLVGKDLYTGGVSWSVPVADVSDYLLDGENEIVIEVGSALSNVQLARGVIAEQIPKISRRDKKRWGNDQKYLSFGPQRAVIVPFAEVDYAVTPAVVTPPTTTPTPVTPTPPAAEPSIKVSRTLTAGQRTKIRLRHLSVRSVKVTLGGRKLAIAKVQDGRVTVTRTVPRNLAGRQVLRVRDGKGRLILRTTVRVVRPPKA
jgi:hypothetical protein